MFKKITSLTNPHIKKIVQLRRQRRNKDVTIIEGYREVLLALEEKVKFQEVYIQPKILSKRENGKIVKKLTDLEVPVFETTKAVFSKICYGDRDEGLLAVCEPSSWSFEDLPQKRNPLFIIVESVEKPGNLGAILRTCDAAGVDGVIVTNEKTDIYNPNVIRASLGTIFSIKVITSSNESTRRFLTSNNIKTCAAVPDAKAVYSDEDLTGSLAIVVGSEDKGLSDFWVKNAHVQVRIPMHGRADSLNVSSSTAILLYEAIRQRR